MSILAFDLGTSGIKTGLFSEDGLLAAEAYSEYPVFYPLPGWAEGRPEDWWKGLLSGTSEVLRKSGSSPGDVRAIGFSSMGGAMVPVDKDGRLLQEACMLWMDMRAIREGEEMLRRVPAARLDALTRMYGNYASCDAARMLWLKTHRPAIYDKAFRFLSVREYLALRMTGEMSVSSYSNAGNTGFYNLVENRLEGELLEAFDIDVQKLPAYVPPTAIAGETNAAFARLTGIPAGTPVVTGCWDNLACMIGGGGALPGSFVCYLGTAAWIGTLSDACLRTREHPFMTARADDRLFYNSVNSHSAGPAFNWVLHNLFLPGRQAEPAVLPTDAADEKAEASRQGDEAEGMAKTPAWAYAQAEAAAAKIPPGCDGLGFLPAFYGGSSLYESPSAAAAFTGLRLTHTRDHMMRAAMEGAGLDLLLGYEYFGQCGIHTEKIRIVGGGAKNRLWVSILASMFGREIDCIENPQHCGVRGAMLLAGIGAGFFDGYAAIAPLLSTTETVEPDPAWNASYRESLARHRVYCEALLGAYERCDAQAPG